MAAKKTAKKSASLTPHEVTETPKPAAKKVAKKATKIAKKSPPATPVTKATAAKPSLDDLARAAYLNYRRRSEHGLPGDSHGDWLEAERQFRGAV